MNEIPKTLTEEQIAKVLAKFLADSHNVLMSWTMVDLSQVAQELMREMGCTGDDILPFVRRVHTLADEIRKR